MIINYRDFEIANLSDIFDLVKKYQVKKISGEFNRRHVSCIFPDDEWKINFHLSSGEVVSPEGLGLSFLNSIFCLNGRMDQLEALLGIPVELELTEEVYY